MRQQSAAKEIDPVGNGELVGAMPARELDDALAVRTRRAHTSKAALIPPAIRRLLLDG